MPRLQLGVVLLIAICAFQPTVHGQTIKCNSNNLLNNLRNHPSPALSFCESFPTTASAITQPLPTFLPSTSYPIASLSSACYCFTYSLHTSASSSPTSTTTPSTTSSTTSSTLTTSACAAPSTLTSVSVSTLPAQTTTVTVTATASPAPASLDVYSPYAAGAWVTVDFPAVLNSSLYPGAYGPLSAPLPSSADLNSLLGQCFSLLYDSYQLGTEIQVLLGTMTLAWSDTSTLWCLAYVPHL